MSTAGFPAKLSLSSGTSTEEQTFLISVVTLTPFRPRYPKQGLVTQVRAWEDGYFPSAMILNSSLWSGKSRAISLHDLRNASVS